MSEIIKVQLDLAKNVIQVHWEDAAGQLVLRGKGQVLAFFSELQPFVVTRAVISETVRLASWAIMCGSSRPPMGLDAVTAPRPDRLPIWIVANPPWHTDAVGGGRLQHQGHGKPIS